jgi:hypothetical protein
MDTGRHARCRLVGRQGFSPTTGNLEFRRRRIDVPRGTMDGTSSLGLLCRPHNKGQDASQIVPPHLPDPMLGEPTG